MMPPPGLELGESGPAPSPQEDDRTDRDEHEDNLAVYLSVLCGQHYIRAARAAT